MFCYCVFLFYFFSCDCDNCLMPGMIFVVEMTLNGRRTEFEEQFEWRGGYYYVTEII